MRTRALLAATALLLGCGAAPTERLDREAYLAVVADPGQGSRCSEIADGGLRTECVALAALDHAEAGRVDAARALCSQLQPGGWQDECHFLTCDGARLVSAEAVDCCKSAGRFRRRCMGHAMGRDAMGAFEALPPGQEAAGLAAVEAVVARYQGAGVARHKAEQIVQAALLQRAPEGPLSPEVCGDIGALLCARVYEEMLRQATRPTVGQPTAGLERACAPTVDVEDVAALGLPVWKPELDAVAQRAWDRVCGQ